MVRENGIDVCEHCRCEFASYIVRNGFNDSASAYCDACETTATLSGWYKSIPPQANFKLHQRISREVEPFLKPCPCGGSFRANSGPICPHCHHELSSNFRQDFLRKNASGNGEGMAMARITVRDGVFDQCLRTRLLTTRRRKHDRADYPNRKRQMRFPSGLLLKR